MRIFYIRKRSFHTNEKLNAVSFNVVVPILIKK